MKRSILALLIVCSVSQGTCKVVYVVDAIDRPGRLVTVCTPETDTEPMPAPRPVMPDLLQNTLNQNRNFNPFGGAADSFNDGFRRGFRQ